MCIKCNFHFTKVTRRELENTFNIFSKLLAYSPGVVSMLEGN